MENSDTPANNTRSSKKDKLNSIEVNFEADDHDLDDLMKSLSDESQTLVKIITVIVTSKFKSEMDGLKSELATKDKKISELQQEITGLKVKIEDLENTVDGKHFEIAIDHNGPGHLVSL